MLTPLQSARLKGQVESTLTDSCTIYARSFSPDGAGGESVTETSIPYVPCRVLAPSKTDEADIAGVVAGTMAVPILLKTTQAISRRDRIRVGSSNYEVMGIEDRTQQFTKRVICTRID